MESTDNKNKRDDRIGMSMMMNCGMRATIINYRTCNDIDVQFKDGIIVKHKKFKCFQKGEIMNPNWSKNKREGMSLMMNCGMKATITKYSKAIGYYDVTEDRFDKPEKIARFAINQLHLDRRAEEYVYVVGLTTKTQALGVFEISHGAVSASICNPREIFIRLLLCGASTFVMIHNHPSGDTNPSKADRMVAQKLKEAGDLLGITMIDSIIIGYHYYLSMKENSNAKLLNRMSI